MKKNEKNSTIRKFSKKEEEEEGSKFKLCQHNEHVWVGRP
jgi:hypothetical protein